MKRKRKNYDMSYKKMAVELLEESGRSASDLSKELGVSACLLRRWRKDLLSKSAARFKPSINNASDIENHRLKKELKQLKLEHEILKKAVSIFSRSDGKYTDL